MRRIYLVRHGQPQFPGGEGYCLGRADFPLDTLGHLQACQLAHALKGKELTVFTSPLKRAYDTALYLSPKPIVIEAMQEMHAGDWDGLSFREIEARWPELYRARATDKELIIPGSEDWHEGQRRFLEGVEKALGMSKGDIAIVAHTTVILSFLCHVTGDEKYKAFSYRQGCGSWYTVELEKGEMHCRFPWERPVPELDEELCCKLMAAASVPHHIREHCSAVAHEAMRIWAGLQSAGLTLDKKDIYHAALLHDIARLSPEHERLGADLLRELGHESIARIIGQHHEPETEDIDEAALVYIADKLIAGTEKIGLKERFDKSLEKCIWPEALAAHARRQAQAANIAEKINRLCGREVIS